MTKQPSTTIVAGRYRVIATIGRGGHAIVYKAFDESAQRTVALKVLAPSPASHGDLRRSLNEAVWARLEHPNIVRVLEYGDADDHLYVATQFVEGRSLAQILRDRTQLEPDYAVEIVVRVGTALTFAHWQGVIHRDVKPSNIMVSIDGNVLLADFGLAARAGEPALTSGRTVVGTPAYMSPEQAMGDSLDARSDVFSLGAVLYEAVTGRRWLAPDGELLRPAEIMKRIVEMPMRSVGDLVPGLPDNVQSAVAKALTKNRAERYQSAAEFVNVLLPTRAVPLGLLAGAVGAESLAPHAPLVRGDSTESPAPAEDDDPTAEVPAYLPQSKQRVAEFTELWDLLAEAAHESKERFADLTKLLVRGLLREAIGYRVGDRIPYFRGTLGYTVEAPFLWIRQSRFPLLFVASDSGHPDVLSTIVQQLEVARTTEFFALLVVVPRPGSATGREADELRRMVANSVFRLDFVVLDRERLASIIAHNSSQRLIEIILEQVDDVSVLSPYIVRGPVPGKMFFGREREIKVISQSIARGDHAVVGGRRIGKSSILLRLKRTLGEDPRYHTIYIDCEAHFNDRDFLSAFSEHIVAPIDGPLPFRQLANILRETHAPKQVVLLLDEVDELLAFDVDRRPAGQLFKTLRAASHEGMCRFVFSGSRTLHNHLRDPRSPFFNFCEAITLGRLDDQSVAEIVRQPMHQLGITMPDEDRLIGRLIELTSSHPNLAQWVCDRLVRSSVERRLTVETLERIAATEEFYETYVSTAWSDAGALEKLISLLIDRGSFSLEEVQEALARHGLDDQNAIRAALNFLQLCALFDRDGTEYRFGLGQFPRIVRVSGLATMQIESLADEARRQCS